MTLKNYYGAKGKYLEEHKEYFSREQLNKEVDFLIKSLRLTKKDRILDLACGNGRHVIELKKRGYDIEGLDFSSYLIKIAEEHAKTEMLQIKFYKQDIHKISIGKQYDKVFLFFSEFGLFNADIALNNISKVVKKDGLFLLDSDNTFRLIFYLEKHPDAPFDFDVLKMELTAKEKNGEKKVRFYTFPELKKKMTDAGFSISKVYGNYQREKLGINSNRMIVVGKKLVGE